jgi:hypothetical protein
MQRFAVFVNTLVTFFLLPRLLKDTPRFSGEANYSKAPARRQALSQPVAWTVQVLRAAPSSSVHLTGRK